MAHTTINIIMYTNTYIFIIIHLKDDRNFELFSILYTQGLIHI